MYSLDLHLFRLINSEWTSPFLDRFMALMSDFNFWKIPLLLATICLGIFGKFKERIFLFLVIFTLIFGDGVIVNDSKNIINRPRPWQALNDVRYVDRRGVEIRNALPWQKGHSTPSGHTCNNTAVAILVTLFYGTAGIPFWILTALVAYSRIYTGSHYPSDVLVSIPFSILYTSLIFYTARWIWKKYAPKIFPSLYKNHPTL